ncbi:MAG: ABC transporter permease, partial [Marinibacterium sp.]|nr:ABC transporter permease [Marinibacterium sp.]
MTALPDPTRPRRVPKHLPRHLPGKLWQHRTGRFGLMLGLALILFALTRAVWTPLPPNAPDYISALHPPSLSHPFGTDATGRDMFSRSLDAAHRSIGAALLVLGAVFLIGLIIGTVAGLSGGVIDTVLMRIADIAMTLPGLVLAFAVLGILGPGFVNLLIALI